MSGFYRGVGGTGDATGDAVNEAAIAIQAATSASASATAANASASAAATSAASAAASAANSLIKTNNLSDVSSVSTARTNLGLATVAATGVYSDLTGKPTLGSAAAANTTDFDPAGAAVALAIALG